MSERYCHTCGCELWPHEHVTCDSCSVDDYSPIPPKHMATYTAIRNGQQPPTDGDWPGVGEVLGHVEFVNGRTGIIRMGLS